MRLPLDLIIELIIRIYLSKWLVKHFLYKCTKHTHANNNLKTNLCLWEITRQILQRQTEVGIRLKNPIPKWACKSQSCVRLMIRQSDLNVSST